MKEQQISPDPIFNIRFAGAPAFRMGGEGITEEL